MLLMTSSPSADRKRAPPTLALHTPPSLARSLGGCQQCQVASANQHDMNSNLAPPIPPPRRERDADSEPFGLGRRLRPTRLPLGGATPRGAKIYARGRRRPLRGIPFPLARSLVRWFVRWFFERSFPHRSIDTVTIFDECGPRPAARWRVETPGDQLGRQPGCLLGGQYNVMEKKSGCQSGGEGPIHAASQMSQQFRFEVQRERQAALEQSW